MCAELNRISVPPDSELAHFLDKAGDTPLLLEKDGMLFRVTKEATVHEWEGYDPARVKAAILKTAGSWADIDTDAFMNQLYRAREDGSRPVTRP